jgi:hypothetical protein
MAALASHSVVSKRRLGIEVVGAFQGRLHPTYVTMQATGVSRKVQRDFLGPLIGGGHVPHLFVRIPVYGRLEQKSVCLKQVASATAPRADVVKQFALARKLRISRPVKAQPSSSIFSVDAVVDAGFLVGEFGRSKSLDRRAACSGHRGALVRLIDRGVAASAHFVADVTVSVESFRRRRRNLIPR